MPCLDEWSLVKASIVHCQRIMTTIFFLYCVLFLLTSDKHSGARRSREIRRSIRRRWDICTSLLVEPPYLRAPASSSKPSAIPCIHRRIGACPPSTLCGCRPLLVSYTRHVSALFIVHTPSNSSSHLFHHFKSSRFHLLSKGREQPIQRVSTFSDVVYSFSSKY